MSALQNSILENSSIQQNSKLTNDFLSLFSNPKKVVFTNYGGSKLLCYDQVFAYIVNVFVENDETLFNCSAVIALEPLPENDSEVKCIKINSDSSSVALISQYYVYTFVMPELPKGIALTRCSDNKGVPKVTVNLLTIGELPNNQNILKAQWLPSSFSRGNVQLSDYLGILYYGNIVKIFNTKNPKNVVEVNFSENISNSIKEDKFSFGFGLTKMIASFDFGVVIDGDNPFFTIIAIDNDSEMYYCGVTIENNSIQSSTLIGPILFSSKPPFEPLDINFIKHRESSSVFIFAIAQENGSIAHVYGFPTDKWSNMLKGVECIEFYVHELVELKPSTEMILMNDSNIEGEYIVYLPNSIFIISINPWLSDLRRLIKEDEFTTNMDNSSLCCHVFQLVQNDLKFCSIANLTILDEDFDRYLAVLNSNDEFIGKYVPTLWEDLSLKKNKKSKNIYDDERVLITENPLPINIPIVENVDEKVMVDIITNLNTALLQLTNQNVTKLSESLKKGLTIKEEETKLIQNYDNLYGKTLNLADEQKDIQKDLNKALDSIDQLCFRIGRLSKAVPQEKLTKEHLKIEEKVYKQKRKIQEFVVNIRDTAVKAVLLRSQYYSKQPSFRPSTNAVKFMMTKTDINIDELKNDLIKLSKNVANLSQTVDYHQKLVN